MSIRFIKHNSIDPHKWDVAIINGVNPLCYGLFGYLEGVCNKQWDALIYNDYEAVFPLPFKYKFGIKYIVQPAFCQQLGAFGNDEKTSTADFISAIPYQFFRVRLQINPFFKLGNDSLKIKWVSKPNYCLKLFNPIQFNKDAKKNIQNLSTYPIEFNENKLLIHEVIALYRKAWGAENPKLSESDFQNFQTACSNIKDCVLIVSADLNTESKTVIVQETNDSGLLGTAIFLISPKASMDYSNSPRFIHYVCAGPTEKGRSLGIMHGIINHCIQKYNHKNFIFDFEGSSIESVASFYKKFGPTDTPYYQFFRGL